MKYRVWSPDLDVSEIEPKEVEAFDRELAVLEFVEDEELNSGEYTLANESRNMATVFVLDSGTVHRYTVGGEWVPRYWASEEETAEETAEEKDES